MYTQARTHSDTDTHAHSTQAIALAHTITITGNPAEKDVAAKLAASLPGSKRIEVEDVSGGCECLMSNELCLHNT